MFGHEKLRHLAVDHSRSRTIFTTTFKLAFKEITWSDWKFVYRSAFLCKPVPPLSAHSTLLYDNNKYANGTMIDMYIFILRVLWKCWFCLTFLKTPWPTSCQSPVFLPSLPSMQYVHGLLIIHHLTCNPTGFQPLMPTLCVQARCDTG